MSHLHFAILHSERQQLLGPPLSAVFAAAAAAVHPHVRVDGDGRDGVLELDGVRGVDVAGAQVPEVDAGGGVQHGEDARPE